MKRVQHDLSDLSSYKENPLSYIENTLSFENQQLKGTIIHKDGEYNRFTGGGARFLSNFRLHKAQKLASKLGDLLHIEGHIVSSAQQLSKLVQSKNWVQGRSTSLVVLACLYYASRTAETGHLMIDFADALGVDVYSLSKLYLRLVRDMNLEARLSDPSLYVPRFLRALAVPSNVERKMLDYVLRLLARMREDWLAQGRRPTGLIAAGFYIACKCFEVSRSMKEVACVLRVSEETVRKRVGEFKALRVAQLTKEEFSQLDQLDLKLEPEDPPAFKRLRIMSEKEEEDNAGKAEAKALDGGAMQIENGEAVLPILDRIENFDELLQIVPPTAENKQSYWKYDKIDENVNNSFKIDEHDNKISAFEDENGGAMAVVDDTMIRPDEFDEAEIEACILKPHESKFKSLAWYQLNKDWLDEQKLKKQLEEAAKERNDKKPKRVKKEKKEGASEPSVVSNNEVVNSILRSKLGKKVNTEALERLFSDARKFKERNGID